MLSSGKDKFEVFVDMGRKVMLQRSCESRKKGVILVTEELLLFCLRIHVCRLAALRLGLLTHWY